MGVISSEAYQLELKNLWPCFQHYNIPEGPGKPGLQCPGIKMLKANTPLLMTFDTRTSPGIIQKPPGSRLPEAFHNNSISARFLYSYPYSHTIRILDTSLNNLF